MGRGNEGVAVSLRPHSRTPLDRPLRLIPQVRRYDWGTRDFIPNLCGRAPTGEPEAELWFGAHPDAPAGVVLEPSADSHAGASAGVVLEAGHGAGDGHGGRDRVAPAHGAAQPDAPRASGPPPKPIPLDRLIAERREEVLGPGEPGDSLPFLTKILSAAKPLSIQAHPDRSQAACGFAVETAGHGAATGAGRNYRDPNHKPELLYALTPFEALSGFRPAGEAARLLASLGMDEFRPHVRRLEAEGAAAYRPLLAALRDRAGSDLAARAVDAARQAVDDRTGTASAASAAAAAGVASAAAAASAASVASAASAADTTETTDVDDGRREALRWIVRIAAHHPDDPLVVAPLFLRLVRLNPGEALFTGAGVPHSYLEGSGVEVMANSDNVLRLGLTSKRVDAAELLDILDYAPGGGAPLKPRIDERRWGTRLRFQPPVDDFRLEILRLGPGGAAPLLPDDRARIALALEGEIEVRNAAGVQLLRPGGAALVPAAAEAITATGRGTLAVTSSNPQSGP